MTNALAVMEHASLWFGIVALTQKRQFKHVPMKLKQKRKHLTGISLYVVHSLSEAEVKQLGRQRQVQEKAKHTGLDNLIL